MTIETRRIRVTIRTTDGNLLVINESDGLQLQIDVQATSTTTPNSNVCRLVIWNLNEASRKALSAHIRTSVQLLNTRLDIGKRSFLGGLIQTPKITFDTSKIYERGFQVDSVLERGDAYVLVEMGYGNDLQTMFEGSSQRIHNVRTDTDWQTHISIGDGEATMGGGIANKQFPQKTRFIDVIRYLIATMGLESGNVTKSNLDEIFERKVSVFGSSVIALGKSALLMTTLFKSSLGEWFVDRGKVYITKQFQSLPNDGIEISQDTGLRWAPLEVQNDMIECKNFPRPDIRIGRKCRLIHKRFAGDYRVESVQHNGTNRVGDLETLVRLSQIRKVELRPLEIIF